MHLLLI